MADSDWFSAIDSVLGALEGGINGTVFVAPAGTVGQLPDAIGGDPKQWIKLQAAAAKSKDSFFELLRAKAHFLMLPQTIVTKVKESWRIQLEEYTTGSGLAGTTVLNPDVQTVVIDIPAASLALARSGSSLGRSNERNLAIFATLYHEMTHALIDLREFYDEEFQNLCADGFAAYDLATGVDGAKLYPTTAFSEAAAYYVSDKVDRWCEALFQLDVVSRNTSQAPVFRHDELDAIAFTYNKRAGPYGIVLNNPIQSPDLSDALRAAIDKQILDSGPLTMPFDDTLLGSLRTALLPP
jgi:hypothetical protein